MAPVHCAAGSDGETNFAVTSLAAPNAASSRVARYSFTARLATCVIHAPELPTSDYPVGRFEPSDNDNGVYLLGATTFEAAETELSAQMNFDLEFERQYGDWRSAFSSDWWPEVAARLCG